jgi:hypothetical protein
VVGKKTKGRSIHYVVFQMWTYEVYDTEHVPFLSQVPGVISGRRYQREALTMNIGGQRQLTVMPKRPSWLDSVLVI